VVAIATRYSILSAPAVVEELERKLYEVLKQHYFVKCTRFDRTDPYDVTKHEMYHLSKALSKIQFAIDCPTHLNVSRLRTEVAPDMVIYALECSMAFETDWWSPLLENRNAPPNGILTFLSKSEELDAESDLHSRLPRILGIAIHAVGRLGEFCDRHDHAETSDVDLAHEVVIPFLRVAFLLTRYLAFDLDAQFDLRLVDVANRYFSKRDS
jgi:hypothetical protein